ncbi:MAG: hypothetical protein VYC12_01325 [Candidatus Thermoplasmatota archaeon]|nr:hypothetical protein [Candidatus Thermoplasmatota archaeon]
MRNKRENFLISGAVLITLGAMITFGVDLIMGVIVGLSGILCFLIGMSTPSSIEMSPEAIAAWKPTIEKLPDAGRFMYRVDVTLDQPYRSQILCGPCGHLEEVDGQKPAEYTCTSCGRQLWISEEE